MRKILFPVLIILELFLLLFDGCVPSKPTSEVEILPAERLVNKLEINRRRIKSFEGSGSIFIKTDEFDNKASFQVILVKPDSLYFTVLGPFGIELAQSLVTKNNFIFYDALHNTAYEGKVTDDVLQNIFKVNLPFNDLIDAFIGAVNLTSHLYKQPTKYSVDYDQYVLSYADSLTNITTVYRIDIRQLGITDFSVENGSGDKIFEGKYSDFDFLEDVAVPYTVDLHNYQDDQSVSIKYKKMIANKPEISINFRVPDDATIIKW